MGRFWHSLLLYHFHSLFEYILVEFIIKKHQQEYYDVLEICNHAGNSTAFIEFSIQMIVETLEKFLLLFRPQPVPPNDRLESAKHHFVNQ